MVGQVHLLKKYGVRVRGHLGQHLLMDPNTVRKIVDALDLENGETILEVGPGLGALTSEILSRGHRVIAVEKDPKFIEILEAEVGPHFPGLLEVIPGDVLDCDLTKIINKFSPTNTRCLTPGVGRGGKVVSNLPYYISTPILFHLIDHRECFHSAVLMMQKEVAARMTAKPRTKDYGRLSVSSSLFGTAETLFDVSPKCFLPAPEVTSRVIRFTFNHAPSAGDETFLPELIRIAFCERRKTLLSLLLKYLKPKRERPEIESAFEKLGLSSKVRGEELTTGQFKALAQALK
ncbi:MAG: Ribosomal RNA small subunit methyltransferase A [Candidatus Omnitrophica bacterium ADurb.Bin277]|nr:MAG: Ribosomal RNA small subunit methyltransferase A [Candidatus Omnitrophica bacterium ADurb.Bin277]